MSQTETGNQLFEHITEEGRLSFDELLLENGRFILWNLQPLKGAITATSSVSGTLSVSFSLKGKVAATSSVSGTLKVEWALKGAITATSSLQGILAYAASERGFYYAKLGSTILTSLEKDSFRITEELNKIPSFEFEIANCSDNRAAIVAGITDTLTIYRRLDSTDTLMFTGRIDVDAIEYLSLERIRIPGYASYIDLNFRFHQHLNSEDAENVGVVFDYTGSYTDYTTEANNDTINDVLLTLDSVGDIVYIGQDETFFGMQVKYSTKGVQAANTTVVFEFSKGSSVWATLDVLDETRTFTEETGTYYITIPHKPSDWAKEIVNSVKKFWIRARVTAGSYTTSPKLDRIKIMNVDVYRVYYFDTAANSIMDDVLDSTGYSMDVTDVCPSDTISMVGEYKTKLIFIAGIANALTWDDSGDKKAYQWWIDTSKKVHFKQERGNVRGNITENLVILNNVEDYYNLSNKLHFLGNYDGLNQLRAVIENIPSQDTHGIRELAVPEEQYNNYIPLKEAAQKAMTYTKAPLQKITAALPTKRWLANSLEVGDTVTVYQPRWNVDKQALQIVRADIGPRVTNVDIGISQEHLDGLKASLQRRLDITGIRMHGSTTLLQFGPETMNYQRVDATTVYPARLKIEIPSDVRYIHKVLLSWTLGNYHADVGPDTGETSGHDHTGYAGAGGAFSSAYAGAGGAFDSDYAGAGGAHTPTAIGTGTTDPIMSTSAQLGYLPTAKTVSGETAHTHTNPSTGAVSQGHTHTLPTWTGAYDNDKEGVVDFIYPGSDCVSGSCMTGWDNVDVPSVTHYHNLGGSTGSNSQSHTHTQGSTGSGTSHNHTITTHEAQRSYIFDITLGAAFEALIDSHTHTINQVSDHSDHLVAGQLDHSDHLVAGQTDHSDHVIETESGESLSLAYDIHEIAGNTLMMLLVNGETVASNYNGAQTDIRIDGWLTTGSNTIELQPAVGQNGKKGGATMKGDGLLFIEPKHF